MKFNLRFKIFCLFTIISGLVMNSSLIAATGLTMLSIIWGME